MSSGRSNSTGPNPGQGAGERDSGRPEGVDFQKEQLHPQELDATGTIVGTLPFDGDVPKGEALLKIQKAAQAAQRRAEKVEREAIPSEYKQQVRLYMDSLLPQPPAGSPAESSTGTSTGEPAESPAKRPGAAGGDH